MLTIVSTNIIEGQTGVYLDQPIEITFNFELHNTSLNGDNFKIYVMPGYAGFIPISIAKVGPKVTLTPQTAFNPNTQYTIYIKGDRNILDSTYEGVASIIGDVMDKNKLINFTTGATRMAESIKPVPTIADYEMVDAAGNSLASQEQLDAMVNANSVLDVIRTYPKNDAIDVSGVQTMTVIFDQEVAAISDMSGAIEIMAIPLNFNDEPNVPIINDVTFSGKTMSIDTNGSISENTRYVVIIHRESIIGIKKQSLPEDYEFTFLTELNPVYTSPYLVRFRGQKLIPDGTSEGTIMEYIFTVSRWIVFHLLHYPEAPEGPPPEVVVKLATCKTVEQMAEDLTLGTMKGVLEKELGDFRIRYDDSAVRRLLYNISERCVKEALIDMGLSGARFSVKSKYAVRRPYPNGKRIIHSYFRGGTYYRTGLARAYVPPDILI